jgi:hypothetical protein
VFPPSVVASINGNVGVAMTRSCHGMSVNWEDFVHVGTGIGVTTFEAEIVTSRSES